MYRGRFAPSPSGPLHLGSIVAALGSYLDAKTQNGQWLLRIEDVDPPRTQPGASDAILRLLDACGFEWEGPVIYQSRRAEAYRVALEKLRQDGLLYACTCSRKDLAETGRRGVDGKVYPGYCQSKSANESSALRFRVPAKRIHFRDRSLGQIGCNAQAECGDFVVKRADGFYSYQIAVVVDDAEQGINHVVRGADLLTSTPRQILLQQALALPTPSYMHVPVVLDAHGDKLSKQTLAKPVNAENALSALELAAAFLGLRVQQETHDLTDFWADIQLAWSNRKSLPLRGMRSPSPCKSLT